MMRTDGEAKLAAIRNEKAGRMLAGVLDQITNEQYFNAIKRLTEVIDWCLVELRDKLGRRS